ncbi:mitogen-activated protein kinase kinase kinase [Paramarasmius palmivorus]|uniref:Mitogen-activated protein kinase kinase kinase n=1 Tax=Paramarasmius palmivorus TaxID=297713 RepID=A0AAW0DZG5_9AGAR
MSTSITCDYPSRFASGTTSVDSHYHLQSFESSIPPQNPISSTSLEPKSQWIKIGEGSFGKVYRARNQRNGQDIAVKHVAHNDTKLFEALRSEKDILKGLDHPNIVKFLGFEESLSVFIEFVPDGSLSKVLARYGRFDEEVNKHFITQMLSGLQYLHSKGIIHRDLKGDNLLISNSGECKITDFGISKQADPQGRATTIAKGTIGYMAPEVMHRNGYDTKIDIWSAGCVAHEMWTGKPPWHGVDLPAAAFRIGAFGECPPLPPDVQLPEVAHDFRSKCLARDPTQRAPAAELRQHPYLTPPEGWVFRWPPSGRLTESHSPSTIYESPAPVIRTHFKGKMGPALVTKELGFLDDYRQVRTGDIRICEEIGTSDVSGMFACRTFSLARVLGVEEGEFLHVGYSGQDAFKAFQIDVDEFTAVKYVMFLESGFSNVTQIIAGRRANIAQLFGYNNRRGLPALIFYDAPIPLTRILYEGNHLRSIILGIYCDFQGTVVHLCGNSDFRFSKENIWIDPRNGAFRIEANLELLLNTQPHDSSNLLLPLPLQAFSDVDIIVDYMTRIFSIGFLLAVYPRSTLYMSRSSRDIPTQWVFSVSPVRNTGLGNKSVDFTETLSRACSISKRRSRGEPTQPMRFAKMPPSYGQVEGLCLPATDWSGCGLSIKYTLDFSRWWLAQAHYVFDHLRIHEDQWEDYGVPELLDLQLEPTATDTDLGQEDINILAADSIVYLFVRPVPPLSDNVTVWSSWASRPISHWSFDPTGQERMMEHTRISFGLPTFTANIVLHHRAWPKRAYVDLERIHVVKGFDPKTTALAQSLEYPIIQVLSGEEDGQISRRTSSILESSTTDYDSGVLEYYLEANSEVREDEDIVVYPRSSPNGTMTSGQPV